MGADQSQFAVSNVRQNNVSFFINGQEYNVKTQNEPDVGPTTLLVDFIRDKAGLKGTKYSCREGGCGACVVMVTGKDPGSGNEVIRAVNSCLLPVFACDGMDITTIEHLGDKKKGYNQLQNKIVKFSGTQCGYCTPGMIMNMYSLQESRKGSGYKAKDVEDAFDGNICRCTGYRPILDAFKSMSQDAPEELKRKYIGSDIEDCSHCPCKVASDGIEKCKISRASSSKGAGNGSADSTASDDESFETCCASSPLYIKLGTGEEWVKPTTLDELFEALQRYTDGGTKYRLVAGNTGTGVFKNDGPYQAYIDINHIPELKQSEISQSNVKLGASVTISSGIDLLQKAGELNGYNYTASMAKHMKRVANVPVRNAGTLAGNLMLKHSHRSFPSDIFLLLETVNAKLRIASSATLTRDYTPVEFLDLDMKGKVILSIHLQPYDGNQYYFKSFKITRRYQNAHAYVNAGFLFKVDKKTLGVWEQPRICYGGINPDFVHATTTEKYFWGRTINQETLNGALDVLDREVKPNFIPPDASPEYRKSLTQALLYKVFLGIYGDSAKPAYKSGATDIERGLHYGKQTFETDQSQWPLYQPVAKLEAFPQTSGEAEYINDIQKIRGELFGAFVLSTVGNATLKNLDASEALMHPGVVAFLQAKDIPGLNNFAVFYPEVEEIFASDRVRFAGQALGLVVAETREAAYEGVKKVTAMYDNVQKPVIKINESISNSEKLGKKEELVLKIVKSPEEPSGAVGDTQTIKGEFRTGGQYHFHMETQIALCVPKEDGIDVFSATQFVDNVQAAVAAALGIQNAQINVSVKRLGGGYGGKISKATQIAAACAVAAHNLNKPVRVVVDLDTNMKMIGKRLPYYFKYEGTIDNNGVIQSLKCEMYCDPGAVANEATSLFSMICAQSGYRAKNWEIIPGKAITNTPTNTYCRAPGSTQGIAAMETIMEHIAWAVKKDPLEVRVSNFIQKGDPLVAVPGAKFEGDNQLPKMIDEMKTSADYNNRKQFVETFNRNNRWKKRGMALVPMRYPQHYHDMKFPTYVAIYHSDGTVVVSHGGIEMGQGINTKCAQVVAHTLKIPLDKVKVKATNNLISPNAGITGGACTSELVCHTALKACEKLLEKMAKVKEEMPNEPWEKVVAACYTKGIQLTAQHQDNYGDVTTYDVWGVNLTEVEVDILTGEYKLVRVDIIEDAGKSLSPEVDIGQIEGAFTMGLGLWTTEKLVYDENTGELLTHNTWEYKIPFPADIPEVFRVTMLKNAPNPYGVLASKATGEPPLCMSVCVLFAFRNALFSARNDAGNTDWFEMNGPVTVEDIQRYGLTNKSQFQL